MADQLIDEPDMIFSWYSPPSACFCAVAASVTRSFRSKPASAAIDCTTSATAWVSVGNLAAGSGLAKWQTIRNCDADAGDSFPGMAFPTVSNGAWVQVTGTIDLSACTTVNKLLLFAGADAGDLYLDDVSLTPLP